MEMKDVAAGLKSKFSAYKQQYAAALQQLSTVQAGISALVAERRSIQCMQCTRDEFLQAMCALVDRQAEQGKKRRMDMLEAWAWDRRPKPLTHLQPQAFTWGRAKAVIEGTADFGMSGNPFLFASDPSEVNTAGVLVDGPAICTVLGDAIKANLKTFFDGVDWPDERPMGERIARLERIGQDIAQLRSTEAELIALIDDNSIKAVVED